MPVTIRQIEAFLAVCDSGSFNGAARRIHISQSGLSVLVRELELALDVRLFERSTRHVALTEAGDQFRAPARRLLADLTSAISNVRAVEARHQGSVVVAAPPLLASRLLVPIAQSFKSLHPQVDVKLMDVSAEHILEGLGQRHIDLGFGVFSGVQPHIKLETLLRGPLVVLLPRNHPLAERRKITWQQLATVELVVQKSGNPFRADVDRAFVQAGVTPAIQAEVAQLNTVISMVEAGMGCTILPPYTALVPGSRRTVVRPVAAPFVPSEIVIATDTLRAPSAAALMFRAAAHQTVERMRRVSSAEGVALPA